MTREETIRILTILKVSYPGFYSKITKADAQRTIIVWTDMFADDDFDVVMAAVKAVINSDTNGFPPNIGTIKEQIRRFTAPEQDTAADAWNQVRNAISYYDAKDNFDRLPELCREIVGGPSQLRDWAMMESSDVNTVVQSNFLRSYRAKEKSRREFLALPAEIRERCEAMQLQMRADQALTAMTLYASSQGTSK